jgi:hypothetical protein
MQNEDRFSCKNIPKYDDYPAVLKRMISRRQNALKALEKIKEEKEKIWKELCPRLEEATNQGVEDCYEGLLKKDDGDYMSLIFLELQR